ncbi:hypothetical protein FP2506_06396 [Fulvimarina pelagi HTCC2506]|uniref:Uncharacterized protein n=1 Tax=Fulvimarina pelagi HTCC2506 TaxID=314231 RepID=Q0G7B7_9HYPH|nr:hypothetical protein FP2506_06396 [Fulvimarina pelagi HTCC2506]
MINRINRLRLVWIVRIDNLLEPIELHDLR